MTLSSISAVHEKLPEIASKTALNETQFHHMLPHNPGLNDPFSGDLRISQ
jgi:hypothetical protein